MLVGRHPPSLISTSLTHVKLLLMFHLPLSLQQSSRTRKTNYVLLMKLQPIKLVVKLLHGQKKTWLVWFSFIFLFWVLYLDFFLGKPFVMQMRLIVADGLCT